jgi:hypothetical protein
MQTFLPYGPDFASSAKCLDNKRLGRQRGEAWQIYQTLRRGPTFYEYPISGQGEVIESKTPWYTHPAVQMWRGYEQTLILYGVSVCEEWRARGFKDTMLERFNTAMRVVGLGGLKPDPDWLDDPRLAASHLACLLAKAPEHYGRFGWSEEPTPPIWCPKRRRKVWPYWWPTKENK